MMIATIQPGREGTAATEVEDSSPSTFSTTRVILKVHTPGFCIGHKNQFVFCANNPSQWSDPTGLDIGLTGDPARFGHKGIQVHVRDEGGSIIGVLSADFHASGYMGDGGPRRGPLGTLAGVQGRVSITYRPGTGWPETTSVVKGNADRDQRILDWILGSIGKDRAWFDGITAAKSPYLGTFDGTGKYKRYGKPGNVCYDYANDAIDKYVAPFPKREPDAK